HSRIGVGGRMDTLQCAIVLAKLDRFDWEVGQRIRIGQRYNQLLDEKSIKRVHQKDERTSIFSQYTIFSEFREELQAKLREAGVPTIIHYPIPLNEQPAYKKISDSNTPVAQYIAKQVISLPMGPELSETDQSKVVSTILEVS
ncbi:MAG: aminotransferase DegT, partial [Deltaproteobacteria bacterium]|nr:aminotransferase DegT [Deltaproteobacteria bacterium]